MKSTPERFTLYDISGGHAGTYKTDRIGADEGAGVYFVRAEGKDSRTVQYNHLRES